MTSPIEVWRENVGLIMEPIKGFYQNDDPIETLQRMNLCRDVAHKLALCALADMGKVVSQILNASVDNQAGVEDACYGLALTVWRAVRAEKAHRIYSHMLAEEAVPSAALLAVYDFIKQSEDGTVSALERVLEKMDPLADPDSAPPTDYEAAVNYLGA